MGTDIKFALNHMVCPSFSYERFTQGAKALGMSAVEFRNDIGDMSVNSMESAKAAGQAARAAGLKVLTINALYPFNIWNDERADQAKTIGDFAQELGAQGLVLCPLVDADYDFSQEDRQEQLKQALIGLKGILQERNLQGFVEVLGFPISSIRFKRDAVSAIRELGFEGTFALVHDTFHHKVAGEEEFFAGNTGLVHISGVEDTTVAYDQMQDSHRILIGDQDRLDNAGQIKTLAEGGYEGYFSFEPFSEPVWNLEDPIGATRESMDFILSKL